MKNNDSKRLGAELVGMKNDAGESPLHKNLYAGLEEVALKVVEKPGKEALEMRDSKGDSSLHLAVRRSAFAADIRCRLGACLALSVARVHVRRGLGVTTRGRHVRSVHAVAGLG